MSERWLPAVGYEGEYEVSDQGRVKSLPRVIVRRNGAEQYIHGGILVPMLGGPRKVHSVSLRRKTVTISRLVAEAFIGPCPAGQEVLHWDDAVDNNRLINLRWGTRTENMADKVRNGNHPQKSRTHCPAGHAYDETNTWVSKDGFRKCRECNKARQRAQRAKQ